MKNYSLKDAETVEDMFLRIMTFGEAYPGEKRERQRRRKKQKIWRIKKMLKKHYSIILVVSLLLILCFMLVKS